VRDSDCVEFLQWALPRMRMRWPGFRRVRRQVCRRIARRLAGRGLPDLEAYRALLGADSREWDHLDSLCRITISRFYRDRAVWDHLGEVLLPGLMRLARRRGDPELRCWSAGCASGEEPYTLAMLWHCTPGAAAGRLPLRILATEADEGLLERARRGIYDESSLRDLPADLRGRFAAEGGRWRIDPACRLPIWFVRQDVRRELPTDSFHLVLCRNLIFTYYDVPLQRQLLAGLLERVVPGGALVTGIHETLPSLDGGPPIRRERPGIHVRDVDG
jgi:chemotaxis protein methyltransferase CheR